MALSFENEDFSPVLKPNFYLSLCEAKLVSHFDPSSSCEVVVCVELLLQLEGLVSIFTYFSDLSG